MPKKRYGMRQRSTDPFDELSTRTQNALWHGLGRSYELPRVPIATVEQLTQTTIDQLLTIPNFGRASLAEVKAMLAKRGLSLRDHNQDSHLAAEAKEVARLRLRATALRQSLASVNARLRALARPVKQR